MYKFIFKFSYFKTFGTVIKRPSQALVYLSTNWRYYRINSSAVLALMVLKTANNYFKESWIWGHGIGAFQNKYGGYTHNIFFEILTSYGMIGMSIFIVLLLMYIYKIFMSYGYYRILLIAFLIIGIFPLLLSIYTFKWQYFWAFIILSIKKIPVNYKKIKGVENEKYY